MNEEPKDLSQLLGLDGHTPEELVDTFTQMADLLMQSISLRVVPLLSPGEQMAYEELLNKNASGEEVYAFLRENVPDLDKIASEEMERLRTTLQDILPPLSPEETAS